MLEREQAAHAGLPIAEAAAHTEANEGYPVSYTGSIPASSSRYHSLSPMSSPEHYRIHTPYQTREIHHYKHHLEDVSN